MGRLRDIINGHLVLTSQSSKEVDLPDEVIDYSAMDNLHSCPLTYNTVWRCIRDRDGVAYVGTYVTESDLTGAEIGRSDIEWVRPL